MKTKALEKFKNDEKEAVSSYSKALKSAKGKEKKTYKHIIPDEKEHLRELKKV